MSVENHDSSESESKPEVVEVGADAQADQEVEKPLTELEQLQKQLEEAQAKADDNWDQLLRAKAEMENIRKRSEREASQARKYGLESIARELLPIYDSLEMGLAELEKPESTVEASREGMKLITQMMGKMMEQFSIREINPQGEVFDPEAHQAMSMHETTEQAPNTVLQVLQKGHRLNDRVLRPAMVIVAKAPEAAPPEESPEDT